jgi:hypothetical protein
MVRVGHVVPAMVGRTTDLLNVSVSKLERVAGKSSGAD